MVQKRFKEDLGILSTLLGAGLDPASGIGMLQQAIADKRMRADTRKAGIGQLIQAGIEGSATMNQSQSDEYLQAMGDALGLKAPGIEKASDALSGFYPDNYGGASIMQALWDETDEEIVASLVQEAKQFDGFDDDPEGVLEFVKNKLKYDPQYNMSPEIVDDLVSADIERAVRTNWTALGGTSSGDDMSLEEATARAAGTYDPSHDYEHRVGDPDKDIGWMPDWIEGPLNALTFGAADNLIVPQNVGDVGQGVAGLLGSAASLVAAPIRAAAGVGQLGKLAGGAGLIGSRATGVRSALAATGDDALSGWAKFGKNINPINIGARSAQRLGSMYAGAGRGVAQIPYVGRAGAAVNPGVSFSPASALGPAQVAPSSAFGGLSSMLGGLGSVAAPTGGVASVATAAPVVSPPLHVGINPLIDEQLRALGLL